MNFLEAKVNEITLFPFTIRTVDKRTDRYRRLIESIRTRGLLVPLMVRELAAREERLKYEVIDGAARFAAIQDLGFETVPVTVHSFTDPEVAEIQLIASIHRLPVEPYAYAHSLRRLITKSLSIQLVELADRLNVDPEWVAEVLELKYGPMISSLVFSGKINLPNAVALSQLPMEEQNLFKEKAEILPPQEFLPLVRERCRAIRSAPFYTKARA